MTRAKDQITAEEARRYLRHENGKLFWLERPLSMFTDSGPPRMRPLHCRTWNKRWAGREAGTVNKSGYRVVMLWENGKTRRFRTHRLVWLLIHGRWPKGEVDHINKNRLDNRIENLREVSHAVNAMNAKRRSDNTSGQTGVVWHKQTGKWLARLYSNGKCINLGLFRSLDDAIAARKGAESKYGYHANHGSVT